MSVRRLLLPVLLAASVGGAWAQPALEPSVKAGIEHVPAREAATRVALIQPLLASALTVDDRLWLLNRLALSHARLRHWDASLATAQQGLGLARNPTERARFTALVGKPLLALKRAAEAFQVYEQAGALLPALAKSPVVVDQQAAADVRQVGGAALAQLGRLPEAMEVLTQALRADDALRDGVRQAEVLNEIAMAHFLSGRSDQAIVTEQRAIDALESSGGEGPLSHYYLRRSHFQSQLGQTDAQEQSLLLGERHARSENNSYYLAVAATNLADVALQRKEYARALKYANEAIPLVEANNDRISLAVGWINRGIATNRLHREGGIAWIERGYEALATIPGQQLDAALVQDTLAEEHAFNGDYERAYAAAQRFKALESKHRKATDMKRMAEADAAYKADLQQRQIDELQREQHVMQRFRLLWVLIGVLGLGIAAVLVLSRRSLRKAYRAMEDMALQDPLTGLKNRRYLSTHIDDDLAQLRRRQHDAHRGAPAEPNCDMAFLMIDMDHFKSVNDTYGHAAGDAVLTQVADILRHATRESDSVARWGGEEFLVVAKSTAMHEVHLLAERIRTQVEAHAFDIGGGQTLRKTCSIGFAGYPTTTPGQPWAHWESVVSLADQCLYRVKQAGRNGWIGAVPDAEGSQVSWDLDQAVQHGEVRLVHTPGLQSREAEALQPA